MNVASSESKPTGITSPTADQQTNKTWLTNRRSLIILAVAMALIIWGNALWLRADKSPPAWDAARYLINSLEAFDLVRHPSVASLKELYFVRNTVRPSIGLVLPTMPIYLLFGVSDDAPTLWTNALFLAIIVFSVYGIGKRLFDIRVGLLAALLIGLNPEIIRLSRIYWAELGVAAVTSLAVYLLVRSDYLRRKTFVLLAGLVLGAGMMQRPIFPLVFLAGPLAFVFIGSLFVGTRASGETLGHRLLVRFLPGIALFALPVLLIDLPFYRQYGQQMLAYIGGFQEAGTFAPVQNAYSLQSLLWYVTYLYASVSWPLHILFVIALIVYVVALIRRRVLASSAILLAWVAVPYIALSLTASKGFTYLSALYPALALMVAFAVLFVFQKSRTAQLVASVLVLALAMLTYWQVSWNRPLSSAWGNRLAMTASPPNRDNWPSDDIIGLIDRLASPGKPVTVGVVSALPNLAEPPLAYYARRASPEMTVIRWTDPVPTMLDADFVIVKTGRVAEDPPRTLEDKNATLVSKVLQQQSSVFYTTHNKIGQYALPDGSQVFIYQRQAPPLAAEVKKVGEELAAVAGVETQGATVPTEIDRTTLQNQVRLGKQLFTDKRYEEALPIFQQVVDANPSIADAQQGLARTMFALGNCAGAVEHQQVTVELMPINGTYAVFGDILIECKRVDEAIAAYQKATELDPQEVRAHFVLAQAYVAKGRNQDAVREFNKTIELDKAQEFTERAQHSLQQLQPQ